MLAELCGERSVTSLPTLLSNRIKCLYIQRLILYLLASWRPSLNMSAVKPYGFWITSYTRHHIGAKQEATICYITSQITSFLVNNQISPIMFIIASAFSICDCYAFITTGTFIPIILWNYSKPLLAGSFGNMISSLKEPSDFLMVSYRHMTILWEVNKCSTTREERGQRK